MKDGRHRPLSTVQTDDPEKLAELFKLIEAGDTAPDPEEKKAAPEAPTQKEGEKQEQAKPDDSANVEKKEEQKDQATEANAEGVQTRDGKHVIPFSVLQSARDRAAQAEQLVRDQEARLKDLQAKLEKGSQGAKDGEGARTGQELILSEEDRAYLGEEFPTVLKALDAIAAKNVAIEQQLKQTSEKSASNRTEPGAAAAETVQDAIDSVPKLAHIQSNDAKAFDQAVKFDAMLKELPEWSDKTLQERFAKATEMVETLLGPISFQTQVRQLHSKTGWKTAGRFGERGARKSRERRQKRSNVAISIPCW